MYYMNLYLLSLVACLMACSLSMTSCTMGIIMAVVAVLLIHMDKNQVGNIKPNINLKYLREMNQN